MANIPVEKKGGMALWPWLLGLLLLGLIGWFVIDAFDDEDDLADADVVMTETADTGTMDDAMDATAMTGMITSLDALLDADNPSALEGRTVRLSGVTASAVTGDSTFWVYNPDEGVERRVFAVLYQLEEDELGAGGTDGIYNVDEGETMTIEGTVQAVEASDPATWGVTGEVERELRVEEVYIRINSVDNLES